MERYISKVANQIVFFTSHSFSFFLHILENKFIFIFYSLRNMAKHYWRPISQGFKESERSGPGRIFYRTQVWSLASLVTNWLTHWLTNCCLADLIDEILAFEDTNSKLVEVVYCCWYWTCWQQFVANLVIKLNFCSDFEHKVWSRFWSWSSGKILKLEFVQHFAADVL